MNMEEMTENDIKKVNTLTKISYEINEQIIKGRGVYLLNTPEALCYVFDAINDHLDYLTGGTIQHD